jgi:hypothetical protein
MISGASAHLLMHLPRLAHAIANPTRTQWTRGRFVKRNIVGGYTHSFLWKEGPNSVGLSHVYSHLVLSKNPIAASGGCR